MSVRRTIDVQTVVAAVTTGAVIALVFFIVLSSLARPRGLQAGLAGANRQVGEIEAKLQSPGDPYTYPAHAVCRAQPEAEAAVLKGQLASAAGADGVTLAGLAVTPGTYDEAAGGLAAVTVQFEATGRYDAVLNLLDGLSRAQPAVFVDSADLNSATSAVDLKFSGRIYCSPSVPL